MTEDDGIANGFGVEAVEIDLRRLVRRQVASLYAHLVTRPTGRAVRMAIQGRLAGAGDPVLPVLDFSQVHVLDFSCADEVVAKLILHHRPTGEAARAFFVFRGVRDPHLGPIRAVLERHRLAAVAQTACGRCRLVGVRSEAEARAWRSLEDRGALPSTDLAACLPGEGDRAALEALVRRGLAFRRPGSGGYLALGALARNLTDEIGIERPAGRNAPQG